MEPRAWEGYALTGAQGSGPVFKPDLYIVARMVEKLLQAKDGALKRTQLQMKSGLNWGVFTKYLDLLLSRDLVVMESRRDGEYVVVTAQGRKAYRLLIESIAGILGERWME
jgi:predicted transcriptional regulator